VRHGFESLYPPLVKPCVKILLYCKLALLGTPVELPGYAQKPVVVVAANNGEPPDAVEGIGKMPGKTFVVPK
jgi:hypothetical protein